MFYKLLWTFFLFKTLETSDPCVEYLRLDEPDRSAAYLCTTDIFKCDSAITENWYRSVSGAGTDIPTSAVPTNKCCTQFPLWINDSLPQVNNTEKEVKVCMSYWNSDCKESFKILVRNCGDFNVYKLTQTDSCSVRYCFGTYLKCPEGESSDNGFYPGCVAVPTIPLSPSVAAGLTDGKDATEDYYQKVLTFTCELDMEPENKEQLSFMIEWYIEDNPVTTFTDIRLSELSSTGFRGEHWEDKYYMGFHVKCKMRVKYLNSTVYGPKFESEFFYAGFKVESSRVDIQEGESKPMKIWLTVPFGCERPMTTPNDVCTKLTIQLREPQYQMKQLLSDDDDQCMFDAEEGSVVFTNLDCKVEFRFEEWNVSLTINITGQADNLYNDNNRITYIRLTTLKKFIADPGWNKASIPDIAVYVADGDKVTMQKRCRVANDPYITTFDGNRFANQLCGEQVLYMHIELPVAVHIMLTGCTGRGTASCVCGIVVRNDDALFIVDFCNHISRYQSGGSVQRQIKQVNCDDKYMKIKQEGRRYEVVLPIGTTIVFEYSGRWINHVTIKPSIFDLKQSSGLCGHFDSNPANDFKLRNGLTTTNRDAFMQEWRANDLKLFDHSLKLLPSAVNLRQYCQCSENKVMCTLHTAMAICTRTTTDADNAEGFFKECAKSRTKRNVYSHQINKRAIEADENVFDKPPITFDDDYLEAPNHTVTWINGWNEILATEKCKEHLEKSKLVILCKALVPNFNTDITNTIEECVNDIKHTGDTHFMDAALSALSAGCIVEAKKFENLTNSNSTSGNSSKSLLDDILDESCSSNCSGNGLCVKENCLCIVGYHGYDCNLRQSNAPSITNNDDSGLCKTDQKSCHTYGILGDSMIPESLKCRAQNFKIFMNGRVETSNEKRIFDGIYVNEFMCKCSIPASRNKRAAYPSTVIAEGYYISISNDGKNFSNEITFINYDSTCYACNNTNISCSLIGNYDSCTPLLESAKPKSEDTNIGMIVGVVVAVIIISVTIAVIFVIKMKGKPKPKVTVVTKTDFSNRSNCHENSAKPPRDRRLSRENTISSIDFELES